MNMKGVPKQGSFTLVLFIPHSYIAVWQSKPTKDKIWLVNAQCQGLVPIGLCVVQIYYLHSLHCNLSIWEFLTCHLVALGTELCGANTRKCGDQNFIAHWNWTHFVVSQFCAKCGNKQYLQFRGECHVSWVSAKSVKNRRKLEEQQKAVDADQQQRLHALKHSLLLRKYPSWRETAGPKASSVLLPRHGFPDTTF